MRNITEISPLIELINNIDGLHHDHSANWLDKVNEPYNLKKNQVSDICFSNSLSEQRDIEINAEFVQYMNQYCENLKQVFFHPFYDFLDADLKVISRVKDPESRISKILHYMNGKNERGKVNLNKCLNDLFGFRVWMDEFDHNQECYDFIESSLDNSRVKIHNSCKGDYRATHIYFNNGNNRFFPWELQIWLHKDDKTNIHSHSLHKQEYTQWAEIYKKTEFREVKSDV
ncbi:hypothetical protein CSV80_00940 [Sporosarcina sp. P12(2017)]|uniref:hypothetical protein n=1 Tax=unclassified Sporosarcina TaxID=2647733 RepID=UPI000C171F3E|nr:MULTISPECIES: hypothetical protein [unclassified Sporosarcina]PIC59122.1 hypothetical protein CSV81_00940 [Sporosarcina sp. P10]PIC62443.1 hypothetical protein CSV80_00940 [Sporosarcina sp. P12(2017)]